MAATWCKGSAGALDFGRRTLAVPVALVEMVGKHMAARSLTRDDRDAVLFTAPAARSGTQFGACALHMSSTHQL